MEKRVKVIYIGTAGHSGSTLLDLALSSTPGIISVGEVVNFDLWNTRNLLCTCREKFHDCSFWKGIMNQLPADYKLTSQGPKKLANYVDVSPMNSKEIEEYTQATYTLFSGIQKSTGVEFIVDSSKSLNRLKLLSMDSRFDIFFLHLIKDGRMIANSLTKPKIKKSFYQTKEYTKKINYWKSLLAWMFVNRETENFVTNKGIKSIKIRYEDLISDYESVLTRIADILEYPLFIPKDATFLLKDRHNIGGSRFRYNENIKIEEKFDNYNTSRLRNKISIYIAGRYLKKNNYI